MTSSYFGYIRVSTAKQGEKGVSLQEQRESISRHAQRYGFAVGQWFEERESAAKRGRPVFSQMLRQLRQQKARGVIIHKIDRSARNLRDWADLGDLLDAGIEVHFANETLDMHTRGGRLSADIQAVIASDFIRNLREETRKGFYGRLKQGLYPLPAPIGYLDRGKGKPKEIDPVRGPIVATLFRLYGTANYPLHALIAEANRLGLTNRGGKGISLNGLSSMLNNPFYTGLVRINATGELFAGKHEPLISKSLYDRVQSILRGKTVRRLLRHEFSFRRLIRCTGCGRTLIGEEQKGHVYYRCQTRNCPTTSVREETVNDAMSDVLERLRFDPEELERMATWISDARLSEGALRDDELRGCRLRRDAIRDRKNRLTDAFIDGNLEKPLFEERKAALIWEEKGVEDRIRELESGGTTALQRLERFLELANSAVFLHKHATPEERRNLAQDLFSNLAVTLKNVVIEPKSSIELLVNRPKIAYGSPSRVEDRTFIGVLSQLLEQFEQEKVLTE
jgi:DNA invertase Pin-like site-specific DNA recombinase